MFEYGSAAFQLAIVLAGASALTTVMWLTFISVGLGVVGTAFTLLGFFAPTLIHSSAKKTPGSAGCRASFEL